MDGRYICPKCMSYTLKQITSKKNGKKFWVCQGPEEECDAIYSDADGKPDFPQENPEALIALEWLAEKEAGLTDWEKGFVAGLVEKAEQQVDKPLYFSDKQLSAMRKICEKFADAPEF